MWRSVEGLVQPGIMAHYCHRKLWIEACCREAVANGVERVVVVGAGFDTLALRLAPQFPQVEFVEIDHPATQLQKRTAIARDPQYFAGTNNLSFISANLGVERLPESINDGKRTLIIAEGVLMYLAPTTVDQLFAALGRSRSPIRLVFSFMTQWDDGSCGFRPRSRWVERWLASRKEPFTWSIPSRTLESYLQTFGLLTLKRATTRDLAVLHGLSDSMLEGEELALIVNQPAS